MVYPHSYRTEHSETFTTNAVYGEYYAAKESKKIKVQPALLKILQYVDSNRIPFYNDLADIVNIKSVSGVLKYRGEVDKMIACTENWLQRLGMKYECFNIGSYMVNGQKVTIPSVILAALGCDPKKKTVCAYLHLDVPEPDLSKWNSDPWTLVNVNNYFYGNGASCGKGPLLMWLHVIEAFQESKMELPVNIKFIIEFMNHEDSQGLAGFLPSRVQDFFVGVYNVVVCESVWLGDKHPCIIYGCVGMLHFQLSITKVENSPTDIRDDMENIVKNLIDEKTEQVLIKNFDEYVEQITPDEERVYETIKGFDIDEVRETLPEFKRSWGQVKLLMSFWRLPSIHIHETLECVCDKKDFSKIKKIFTLKIVPRQVIEKTGKNATTYIKNVVKELNIQNTVTCELLNAKRPWFENFRLPCYNAARRAITQIYKEEPNMIREAIGREAVTILDRVLEKNIVMMPLCSRSSNPGGPNERISSRNYYEGTKVIAAYLFQTALIQD